MIRGTPPPTVPPPTEDGYYWVRIANARYVHVNGPNDQPCKSYWTWERPEIEICLVRLDRGMTDWMGSDEGYSLEDQTLIEVIAKIEEPK